MSTGVGDILGIPASQQAIIDKCVYPTGSFIPFAREAIEQSVSDRFEQMVRKYPHRLAVKAGDEELTYDELNRASNRIAHAILGKRGKGAETVALMLDNDAPAIAAILGALKAGKTYVPLDPSLPAARTAFILENAQANLVITEGKNLTQGGEFGQSDENVILVDHLDTELSEINPGLRISPDSPAWIVYTSGSTGQPKGVFHSHRNALHMIMNYANNFKITDIDRLSMIFSYSVHGGTYGTLMGLLNGAAIHMLDFKRNGLGNMADWFVEKGITVFGSVPTVFRQLAGEITKEMTFPDLRLIYLAGEPTSARDVELYKRHFAQDCIFVNRLGSTETDAIRMYFMDKDTQFTGSTAPVGYAVKNKEVLLLDDDGLRVGFDEIGEIAVKSSYLALGYWQRPDLTEASFMLDPDGGGQRIYRTGDLGLMLPDGCLLHKGRKDFQVKIRGYRVEVAEVELALTDIKGVKEAFVTRGEDRLGNDRLIAYIVPCERPSPSVSMLRRMISQALPDYMVPSSFVMLDVLPTAANGKIDRSAMPAPGYGRPDLDSEFVAPRTPVEVKLSEIWAQALELDEVGMHDGFFDLGGHSLLASQVVSRAITAFQVELPLKALFESPTVAEMAIVITEHRANKVGRVEVGRMLAQLEALTDRQAREILSE